jgi:hypothetical protein
VFTPGNGGGNVPTAAFNFRQLRAELTALVGITAQTAWTTACQFVVLPAGNGEVREVPPSSYVSQRRPALRRATEAPPPSAHFSDPTDEPFDSCDVGRFKRELDALRHHVNQLAFHRELDRGSARQCEIDDGGIATSLSLQQRHAAAQPALVGDALTNAVRLLEKGSASPEHARGTSLSVAANAG